MKKIKNTSLKQNLLVVIKKSVIKVTIIFIYGKRGAGSKKFTKIQLY